MAYETKLSTGEIMAGIIIVASVLLGIPHIIYQKHTNWITIEEVLVKKGDAVVQNDVLLEFRFHKDPKESRRQLRSPSDGRVQEITLKPGHRLSKKAIDNHLSFRSVDGQEMQIDISR